MSRPHRLCWCERLWLMRPWQGFTSLRPACRCLFESDALARGPTQSLTPEKAVGVGRRLSTVTPPSPRKSPLNYSLDTHRRLPLTCPLTHLQGGRPGGCRSSRQAAGGGCIPGWGAAVCGHVPRLPAHPPERYCECIGSNSGLQYRHTTSSARLTDAVCAAADAGAPVAEGPTAAAAMPAPAAAAAAGVPAPEPSASGAAAPAAPPPAAEVVLLLEPTVQAASGASP